MFNEPVPFYCTWLIEWKTLTYSQSNLMIECSYLHTPVGSYMLWSYQPRHTLSQFIVFVTDELLSSSAWRTIPYSSFYVHGVTS